jgi:ABC-type antimicrobial peptide transport system permease subunit
MLFDTSFADPVSLAAGVGALGLAAVIANLVPVRRAIRVDPIDALRCQ